MANEGLTTTTVLSSTVQLTYQATQTSAGGWSSPDSVLTKLFSGEPSTIAIAFIVTITLPILLHLYFYTSSARARSSGVSDGIPNFLLLGPVGSGKTSLVTLLQRGMIASNVESEPTTNGHERAASPTRLSQITTTVGMHLPPGIPLGSNKYRSENDFEVTASKNKATPYKIIDTPGHGKLRTDYALGHILKSGLRGVIFLLDSTALEDTDALQDCVRFLHDVLLALQRRPKVVKKAKGEDVRVLIACNKQDLFTALPPGAVKEKLQSGLDSVRRSKRRNVTVVDARDDVDEDEDETVLGGGGEEQFTFKMFEEEFGVQVDVAGGTVTGDEDGKGVRKWEEWIGQCL